MMMTMMSHFMATGGSWFSVGAWNIKCEGCSSQLSRSVYWNSVHAVNSFLEDFFEQIIWEHSSVDIFTSHSAFSWCNWREREID